MIVNPTFHYENSFPRQIERASRYDNRIAFWADVIDVDSSTNSCTVVNDQGLTIPNIQIAAKGWVVKEEGKEYASCERNLPPIGARVFVLVPDGNIANAIVLCSGFPLGEPDVQSLWTNADGSTEDGQKQIQKMNRIAESVSQGGWHITEKYDTGNYKFESADGKLSLEINPVQVNDKETGSVIEQQIIKLVAWDNSIEISPVKDESKGIEKKVSLTIMGNTFDITDKGITITDINKNEIIMSDSGLSFNGYLTVEKKQGI